MEIHVAQVALGHGVVLLSGFFIPGESVGLALRRAMFDLLLVARLAATDHTGTLSSGTETALTCA